MRRLVLFARRPRLGRVKTRLVPPLEPGEALALYRAFLEDQIHWLRSLERRCGVELCLDGPWEPGAFEPGGALPPLSEQGPGDLGARLLRAFERARDAGARATVVVGSDSPTLPARTVLRGLRELERGAALVVAPADDGGYVLIGMRRPLPALFRDQPWGSPRLLEATRASAAAAGIAVRELPGWYDVDDLDGLRRLRRDLGDARAARRCPRTARALAALPRRLFAGRAGHPALDSSRRGVL